MNNWKELTIFSKSNLKEAMKKIDDLGGQGLYVVDNKYQLLGSLTDGDIRRCLLNGFSLDADIKNAMKENPIFATVEMENEEIVDILGKFQILSVPVLDQDKVIVDIYSLENCKDHGGIQVVLMAGGMGTRLGKITQDLPKPMVKVAGQPILERILKRLMTQGFSQFHISVNYKAEIIESYFKAGENHGCKVSYLRENKRLGTAGPLSLLKNNGKPIVVMNGDLLTHVDVGQLLNFHQTHNAQVTMCTRNYEIQVPFGVIDIQDGFAKSFLEKPVYDFNVNAGIYIINPEVLSLIPKDEYYDMSTLLNDLLLQNADGIACFPIVESWIDVGSEPDLMRAYEFYKANDSEER